VSIATSSRGRINFLEEMNYRMEETQETDEVNYVLIPDIDK
jgi:hypothetical protein